MPQVAEKTFEVIDKFVDAPRIIVDSDVRVTLLLRRIQEAGRPPRSA